MDSVESEFFDYFLDLSDVDENERNALKDSLFGNKQTSNHLQLPWSSNNIRNTPQAEILPTRWDTLKQSQLSIDDISDESSQSHLSAASSTTTLATAICESPLCENILDSTNEGMKNVGHMSSLPPGWSVNGGPMINGVNQPANMYPPQMGTSFYLPQPQYPQHPASNVYVNNVLANVNFHNGPVPYGQHIQPQPGIIETNGNVLPPPGPPSNNPLIGQSPSGRSHDRRSRHRNGDATSVDPNNPVGAVPGPVPGPHVVTQIPMGVQHQTGVPINQQYHPQWYISNSGAPFFPFIPSFLYQYPPGRPGMPSECPIIPPEHQHPIPQPVMGQPLLTHHQQPVILASPPIIPMEPVPKDIPERHIHQQPTMIKPEVTMIQPRPKIIEQNDLQNVKPVISACVLNTEPAKKSTHSHKKTFKSDVNVYQSDSQEKPAAKEPKEFVNEIEMKESKDSKAESKPITPINIKQKKLSNAAITVQMGKGSPATAIISHVDHVKSIPIEKLEIKEVKECKLSEPIKNDGGKSKEIEKKIEDTTITNNCPHIKDFHTAENEIAKIHESKPAVPIQEFKTANDEKQQLSQESVDINANTSDVTAPIITPTTVAPGNTNVQNAPPPSGKSWASLFQSGRGTINSNSINVHPQSSPNFSLNGNSENTFSASAQLRTPPDKLSSGGPHGQHTPLKPLARVPPFGSQKETIVENKMEDIKFVSAPVVIATTTPVQSKAPPVSSPAVRDDKVNAGLVDVKETKDSMLSNDPNAHRIGEFLMKCEIDHKTVSLTPRGLTNKSSYCYVNSVLQALLACSPFYNLIRSIPFQYGKLSGKSPTPILDSMVDLIGEFVPLPANARVSRRDKQSAAANNQQDQHLEQVNCGPTLEPSTVYRAIQMSVKSDLFNVEGRQEDAEEFLGCLLNALNDEMIDLLKLVEDKSDKPLDKTPVVSKPVAEMNGNSNDVEDEWKVMGPKNRGSVTRRTDFGRSPISDIFRGHLNSRVQRARDQCTDNVQPFFTLQLDIEKTNSVKDALENLVNRNSLEGVTCSRTQQTIEAWQQVTIEELPCVLVLHLKCFNYSFTSSISSKIIKNVEFPVELKIDAKLISPNNTRKYTPHQKKYKLFAVIYHDGKDAYKGHYITDAFHVGYGCWIRYDDSSVRAVAENQVLHPRSPRMPYLLFYRRFDTILAGNAKVSGSVSGAGSNTGLTLSTNANLNLSSHSNNTYTKNLKTKSESARRKIP